MPKDDREIVSAVRLHAERNKETGRAGIQPRALYTAGMEDELAEAADKATLQRLYDQGAIVGKGWGLKAAAEEGGEKAAPKTTSKETRK